MIGTLFHPFALGKRDLEAVTVGGVRSMLMLVWDVLAAFPALSRHVPLTDWPPPSPRVVSEGALNTPDRVSAQVKLTVTVALFQPLELAPGDLEPEITGDVLSMLIPETVAEAVFPALSVQLPVADWPWTSANRIDGLEKVSTADSVSLQVKLMVTLPLFHPLVLADGEALPVMVGSVRSMLMLVWDVLAEFPAESKQVPVTDCPPPSARVTLDGTLNTPDKGSVHAKLTVTVTLFQPLEFGPTDFELVITGGVLSILTPETVPEPTFPARSVHVALLDWPVPSEEMI